jgi:hypothetical protein
VPLVIKPCACACRAERLARATAGPYRNVICPSCSTKSEGPGANAGEEVALGIAGEILWLEVADVSVIDVTWCNVALVYQPAKPLGGVGLDLVVIRARHS